MTEHNSDLPLFGRSGPQSSPRIGDPALFVFTAGQGRVRLVSVASVDETGWVTSVRPRSGGKIIKRGLTYVGLIGNSRDANYEGTLADWLERLEPSDGWTIPEVAAVVYPLMAWIDPWWGERWLENFVSCGPVYADSRVVPIFGQNLLEDEVIESIVQSLVPGKPGRWRGVWPQLGSLARALPVNPPPSLESALVEGETCGDEATISALASELGSEESI